MFHETKPSTSEITTWSGFGAYQLAIGKAILTYRYLMAELERFASNSELALVG